jgi:hypothetical protein
LAAVAAITLAEGQTFRAAQLLSAVDAVLQSIRTQMLPYDLEQYHAKVAAARAQLSEAAFNAAWEAGQQLTLEQAIALAQSEPPVMRPHTPSAPP